MTTTYPFSPALPGSEVAWRWHGGLAPAVVLFVGLATAARSKLFAFGRGVVNLAAAVFGSRRCP
jgi:hypothetical protein